MSSKLFRNYPNFPIFGVESEFMILVCARLKRQHLTLTAVWQRCTPSLQTFYSFWIPNLSLLRQNKVKKKKKHIPSTERVSVRLTWCFPVRTNKQNNTSARWFSFLLFMLHIRCQRRLYMYKRNFSKNTSNWTWTWLLIRKKKKSTSPRPPKSKRCSSMVMSLSPPIFVLS